MQIERVVINAFPLITRFRAGLHPLLPQLFSELYVPEAVWDEVTMGDHDDPAKHGLAKAEWLQKITTTVAPDVLTWNLGAGETAVLSHALKNEGCFAIVDDRAARRCAHILNIHLFGTAGVIVLAKRRGLIDSVENELRQLQHAGLWLSETMVRELSAAEDGGL